MLKNGKLEEIVCSLGCQWAVCGNGAFWAAKVKGRVARGSPLVLGRVDMSRVAGERLCWGKPEGEDSATSSRSRVTGDVIMLSILCTRKDYYMRISLGTKAKHHADFQGSTHYGMQLGKEASWNGPLYNAGPLRWDWESWIFFLLDTYCWTASHYLTLCSGVCSVTELQCQQYSADMSITVSKQ